MGWADWLTGAPAVVKNNTGTLTALLRSPRETVLGWILVSLVSFGLSIWSGVLRGGARAGDIIISIPPIIYDPIQWVLKEFTGLTGGVSRDFVRWLAELVAATGWAAPLVIGVVTGVVALGAFKILSWLLGRVGVDTKVVL